jgi:hypothetical protein
MIYGNLPDMEKSKRRQTQNAASRGCAVPLHPSLILLGLEFGYETPELSNDLRTLQIDVVFCPPRTRSVPSVKALLAELQEWPRLVLTDRLLDLPDAWHSKHPSGAIAEFYASSVIPFLENRQTVLLAGSAESLARIRRVVDGNGKPLSDQENLPSGQPLVYTFDRKLRPLCRGKDLHWTEALHCRML